MKIERPLDLLNNSKGREVLIYLKDGRIFSGTLLAFDLNINVVIDNAKELDEKNETKKSFGLTFIRGDGINFIS